MQQNSLRWYGHVLRKDDDDWAKKCMEYEVEGPRPRGRPKRTWREVIWEDCQARKLNKEDATDRCKWRKLIKEVHWPGWVWVGECFFWYRPTRVVPDKRPLNGCCCCTLSPTMRLYSSHVFSSLSFHTRTLGWNFLCQLFVALNHMSITNSLCFGTHSSLEITLTLRTLALSSCRTII